MLRVALLLLFAFTASASEWLSGTWVLAERKLDRSIEQARAKGDRRAEARLLAQRASLFVDRSSYHHLGIEDARRSIDEARRAAEASGDLLALGDATHQLARYHYWQKLVAQTGDWASVDAMISDALLLREESGDEAGLSDSWFYRGLVRQMQEDYAPAREAFEKSIHYAKDPLARSFGHRHLGYVIQLSGDLESARKHYQLSLDQRREAGAHALVPFALNLLADFELETTKDRARAKALLRESAQTARCAKSWRGVNAAEAKLAELANEDGDAKSARKHAQRALEAAKTYGDPQMIEEARRKVSAL